MKDDWFPWLIAYILVMVALIIFGGCSPTAGARLLTKQLAVQDCILAGGHARLGPGDTILCDFGEIP